MRKMYWHKKINLYIIKSHKRDRAVQKGKTMSERRLKAKCVEANVNVESLAKALNMSVSTYYRKLVKNTFTVNDVIGIANCLHP